MSAPPQDPIRRRPPPAQPPGNRLLQLNRAGAGSKTPAIPPSLAQKLANNAQRNNPNVDATTAALQGVSLGSHDGLHPALRPVNSDSVVQNLGRGSKPPGLAGRRAKPNLNVRDIPHAVESMSGALNAGLGAGRPTLANDPPRKSHMASPFANFSRIVDPSGRLNFSGKAILHASGVNFANGSTYSINMGQMELQDELGKGAYGAVKKVLHRPTNVTMAMKEIRLELDKARLDAIIMELDVLNRAVAPEIVEFYGAFFIESCVYYCMEYMDAGSMDKLEAAGVPEDVLARIAACTVRGLKFLKDELNVIHRDVKPTNILINTRGDVKLCDFGVSGQLNKSLAKTNIGCQSYMAPERIQGESRGQGDATYSVSSDVWSLGLTIVEIGVGRYPYPPEAYENVFSQLTAIIHGDPPELPEDKYSSVAREFVARCLDKHPSMRASYTQLLNHPWIVNDAESKVDMPAWVTTAMAFRDAQKAPPQPNGEEGVSHSV